MNVNILRTTQIIDSFLHRGICIDYKEIYIDYEDDIVDNQHLDLIFYDKIGELSGEGELLPHHEYYINYEEKYCIFNDIDFDYETGEKFYTKYKIIIRQSQLQELTKKFCSSFNIFLFTKIDL